MDRWLGKVPAGLDEVMGGDGLEIAAAVMKTVALRAATAMESMPAIEVAPVAAVTGEDDPMPAGFVAGLGVRVPIGWIDTGIEPATGRVWIGGDVLVPGHVRAAIADGGVEPGEIPLEGASLDDLRDAVRRMRRR